MFNVYYQLFVIYCLSSGYRKAKCAHGFHPQLGSLMRSSSRTCARSTWSRLTSLSSRIARRMMTTSATQTTSHQALRHRNLAGVLRRGNMAGRRHLAGALRHGNLAGGRAGAMVAGSRSHIESGWHHLGGEVIVVQSLLAKSLYIL